MPQTRAAEQRLDRYLLDLRRALRGLPEATVSDIENELRSHVFEKAGGGGALDAGGVESALAGLGEPEELARQYRADDLLLRAQSGHSPLLILHSLFRAATLSVAGVFILVGSAVGYAICAAIVACAVLKVAHPATAGLWLGPDGDLSLRMGFGAPPVDGREILGWWIVPIGLALGAGLHFLTIRFGRWGVRRVRRARPSGEA
ncbi:MAG: hypothetical protein WCC53_12060 [Thermoanaerobaculia bacterium]